MHTPTTAWDRGPTDKELDSFYGKDKGHAVHDLIIETLTETVRTVSHKALSLPYVTYFKAPEGTVAAYQLKDIVADYGVATECLDALMAVIERSDCPLVATWRMAIAKRFADAHADDVEEFQS